MNAAVVLTNPISLHGGLLAQQKACRDPELAPRLKTAGLNPQKCLERLDPVVRDLGAAIAAGTLGEPKKGR